MHDYWSLTEAERAKLTRDDVARYQDFELMKKGVLKAPEEPALVPVPERPKPVQAYALACEGRFAGLERGDLATFNLEAAKNLISGDVYVLVQDYEIGPKTFVARPVIATMEVMVYTAEQATKYRSTLLEIKAAEERNEREISKHGEALKKQQEALKGLWEDWHDCCEKDRALCSILTTFERYLRLCGDDRNVAAKFLREVHAIGEIDEASDWTGVDMRWVDVPEYRDVEERAQP